MNDPKTAIVLGVAVLVVLLVAVASLVLLRRRRNLWRQFARRHGCSYQELQPHGFQVKGQVDGRRFQLVTEAKSSDTGALGIEEVTMSLSLNGSLPAGLFLEASPGMLGDVQRAMEEKQTPTGDDEFDKATVLSGDHPGKVLDYATSERRKAFLKLMSETGTADVQLRGGELRILDREMVARLEVLENWLALLRQAAPVFDAK